jgi:hypothetical protein
MRRQQQTVTLVIRAISKALTRALRDWAELVHKEFGAADRRRPVVQVQEPASGTETSSRT